MISSISKPQLQALLPRGKKPLPLSNLPSGEPSAETVSQSGPDSGSKRDGHIQSIFQNVSGYFKVISSPL